MYNEYDFLKEMGCHAVKINQLKKKKKKKIQIGSGPEQGSKGEN